MGETILFPDVVAMTVGFLNDTLPEFGTDVPCSSRVPETRPERFVTVQRTGGPSELLVVDSAQLTIEAWGEHDEDAHDLAQLARAVLHSMAATVVDDVMVYTVTEFSGPAHLPDPHSEQSRYSFTVQLRARGAAILPTGS